MFLDCSMKLSAPVETDFAPIILNARSPYHLSPHRRLYDGFNSG